MLLVSCKHKLKIAVISYNPLSTSFLTADPQKTFPRYPDHQHPSSSPLYNSGIIVDISRNLCRPSSLATPPTPPRPAAIYPSGPYCSTGRGVRRCTSETRQQLYASSVYHLSANCPGGACLCLSGLARERGKQDCRSNKNRDLRPLTSFNIASSPRQTLQQNPRLLGDPTLLLTLQLEAVAE